MRYTRFLWSSLFLLFYSSMTFAADITTSLAPTQKLLLKDTTIDVPVVIDLSRMQEKLGSFTATLSWNPQGFSFEGYSGGTTKGFENPVVNSKKTKDGLLTFAAANPYGAEGKVNVLNVKLKVIGDQGQVYGLNIEFTAMSAAYSFNDLLPYWNQTATDVQLNIAEPPKTFRLEQNHPNPFNPSTEIQFQVPKNSHVKIEVFNLSGQSVRTLVDKPMQIGVYNINWDGKADDGSTVPTGMYVYVMNAEDFHAVRKLLLVK